MMMMMMKKKIKELKKEREKKNIIIFNIETANKTTSYSNKINQLKSVY